MPRRRFGRRQELPDKIILLAPYLAGLSMLIVIPAAVTLAISLFNYDLVRPPAFVGLANFRALIDDDVFRLAVRNSIAYVLLAVPLRLVIVVALALALHPRALRAGNVYRALVLMPIMIPEIAWAIAWLWIFNPIFGPLNVVLGAVGLSPVAWLTDRGAAHGAIVIVTLLTVGESFAIAIAARRAIPRHLYDMALTDGAGRIGLLKGITVPMMAPVLALLALRDVVVALQATMVPSLVITDGGPPPYATTYLPVFIFDQAFEYLRYGYAAAAATAVLVVSGLVMFLQARVLRSWLAMPR